MEDTEVGPAEQEQVGYIAKHSQVPKHTKFSKEKIRQMSETLKSWRLNPGADHSAVPSLPMSTQGPELGASGANGEPWQSRCSSDQNGSSEI